MLRRRRFTSGLLTSASGIACATTSPPEPSRHPLLGKALPEFERPTFDGEMLRTTQHRGQVVALEFFAEWCAPCRTALPIFETLRRTHPRATFIGISEDEHVADAIWLLRRLELGFAAVHDRDRSLWNRFAMRAMPTTFVTDRRGTIRWVAGPDQVEAELRYAFSLLA